MRNFERYYRFAYRRARDAAALHWHSETIPVLLEKTVRSLGGSGTALDIGCGTGVQSVFMAQRGLEVTALDFVPDALKFAVQRAEEKHADVEFVHADILNFEPPKEFDLIFDGKCFHGLDNRSRVRYKQNVLNLLRHDDDGVSRARYVLVHFGKRNAFDISLAGPKKRRKGDIERFFAPEMVLEDFIADTDGLPVFQYVFKRSIPGFREERGGDPA